MDKNSQFASRITAVLNRCDGGKSYKWKQAANDMERVIAEMNTYHPKNPGQQLILRQLKREAESWVYVWRMRA